EQFREQMLEVAVDHLEGSEQAFARLLVEIENALAQPLDRLDQIVAFGGELPMLVLDLAQFFFGAQIDRAEPLALAHSQLPGVDRRPRGALLRLSPPR